MRKVSAWDLLFWIIVVAIVASVVRPGSKAASAIAAITDAVAAVVGEATGYYARGGT